MKSLLSSNPNAKIVITGHSLGAALATFAAVQIKEEINPPASQLVFYSFGSPRTGNEAFTDYVFKLYPNGGYQRVTHYNDVVPHLPPTEFDFNHVGDEVWYNVDSDTDLTYKVCLNSPGRQEDLTCSNSILATGIDAHLNYMGRPIVGICSKG